MSILRAQYICLSALCILCLHSLTIASISEASMLEYPYIYKSPRSMGMGGASIAVGGTFDSVFQNPAGLAYLEQDDWEVNLISISAGYGQNSEEFVDDMEAALDVGDVNLDGDSGDDELRAVLDVLEKYQGKNLHMDASALSSMARGGESVSWGIGMVGSARFNATPRHAGGTNGLLEVDSVSDYGMVIGAAFNSGSSLRPGFSMKFINRDTLKHRYSARELVEHDDDLEDYTSDYLVKEGAAFGLDAGVIYELRDVRMRPAIGVSVLNIGDMDFKDAGVLPMTLNMGISVRPELPLAGEVVIGLDMVDITYEFDQDSDAAKRLRIGVEAVPFESRWAGLAIRTGMYQGYGTFGADLRLAVLSLSYNTYTEEMGAYAGQSPDRRHVYSLSIAW